MSEDLEMRRQGRVAPRPEDRVYPSAMREMSKAIRGQLERYGSTLHEIPTQTLFELGQIVGAYAHDIGQELLQRRAPTE